MKKLLVLAFALVMILPVVTLSDEIVFPGEELLYEVSFLGIKLGSVKVITEGYVDYDGKQVIKAQSYMDSYSGLPFVDLHAIFDSWMDKSLSHTYKFVGRTKEPDNRWNYDKLLFQYDQGKISFEKWLDKQKLESGDIKVKGKWNDGLSLFFLARQYTKLKKSYKIPTVVENDTSMTTINFLNKKENIEIDAVDYEVKTVYFYGKANWQGIYGVTGDFEGWFSDDAASVPIKAKMKVYLGSVDITLISWKRGGWKPPKA